MAASMMRTLVPRRTAVLLASRTPQQASFTTSSVWRQQASASSSTTAEAQTPAKVPPAVRDVAKEQAERNNLAVEAEVVNDAPPELRQRQVRVYKPTKTANSSGKAGTSHWRVDFDTIGSTRWENPLMGWASSGDYMQGTYMKFKTKEDAIHFCEKQNWPFYVQEPHKARIPPKSYAANYNYVPGKLRVHHTK